MRPWPRERGTGNGRNIRPVIKGKHGIGKTSDTMFLIISLDSGTFSRSAAVALGSPHVFRGDPLHGPDGQYTDEDRQNVRGRLGEVDAGHSQELGQG